MKGGYFMVNAYQRIIDDYNAQKKVQEDFLKQQQANEAKKLQNQVNKTSSGRDVVVSGQQMAPLLRLLYKVEINGIVNL